VVLSIFYDWCSTFSLWEDGIIFCHISVKSGIPQDSVAFPVVLTVALTICCIVYIDSHKSALIAFGKESSEKFAIF